jgi:mRNA interferase RelE/StbE
MTDARIYKLRYSKNIPKQLKKIDQKAAELIQKWLYKHINNCENPRNFGKALSHNLKDFWRYRIGNYRVIAKIEDEELIVLCIKVGHRRNVYDK